MESFITRQSFLCSSCDEADSGRIAFNADVEVFVVMTPEDLRRPARRGLEKSGPGRWDIIPTWP